MEKTTMSNEDIKLFLEACTSSNVKTLEDVQAYLNRKKNGIELVMTIVCKNEEKTIEQHIRFHKAMGVDGFIVLNHNSTDNTLPILEKLKAEGIVYEIITMTTPAHEHNVWVDGMVKLARDKYHANWIINADADEFYYSKSLNLKESIRKAIGANVIMVDSTFLYPDDREDFLSCPYFVTRPFSNIDVKLLNLNENDENLIPFIGSQGCTKVIHNTADYIAISMGNHDVNMINKKMLTSSDINLYHYHIKNYNELEAKVFRWLDSAKFMPDGMGTHMKKLIELYQNGNLRKDYDAKYGKKMKNFLMKNGVVTIDPSVANFLQYKGIFAKKKYDIIYSIGTDCACAGYLKKYNLRNCAGPFDWLTRASFETRMNLIANDFKDFFNIKDIKLLSLGKNEPINQHMNNYKNIRHDFYYYHDFPAAMSFENAFIEAKEKYNRRIKRFMEDLKNKEKVLLIYHAHSEITKNSTIKELCNKVCEKYQKQIDFVILENDDTKGIDEFEEVKVSDNIIKYRFQSEAKDSNGNITNLGNLVNCGKIYSRFELK